ncbi:cytochrome P450 [Rhodococcus wratislaviensis]|uniref:Putative cytochrome P450 n=1 Tax=Rhodococcus wratislaviensis NBRC 100605 TaxID=1219028 RepID=X0Q834_RHOWR|nr:cytochrome P450 [Rhodococcus wratislaviensis]GAF47632.1 putative cytochrome P450 [Rhodococcus wratislaviensis NBRC 100605]
MTDTVDSIQNEHAAARGVGGELDFDHWSSKITYDPYDAWARMRNECPVAHTPRHGGFFVLTRYDDVFTAALDPEIFSSDGDGTGVAIPPQEMSLYPIDADPPLHTGYRQLLNPFLSMRQVAKMEDWIRSLARRLIADFPKSGSFDIAAAFTLTMPRRVGFHMLNFPEHLHDEVADSVSAVMDDVHDRQGDGAAKLFTLLSGILAERRAEGRRDDLLDTVVFGEIDGKPVDEQQSFSMLVLLLMGGLSTTSAALASMIQWLGDHPEDLERLRADPDIHKYAVDEFVRWSSPVAHIGRTTMRDTEIDGCPIPKGSRVLLGFGSANRDTGEFDRPDEVIVDRQPNRHAGFGVGPHRCIGSHLAKLQIKIALEELLAAMPPFRIDHSQTHWKGGETRLMDRLVVAIEEEK